MNSDGKRNETVDPNLDNKSRPSSLLPSQNVQKHVLGNRCYKDTIEVDHLPAQIRDDMVSQEPSLVDGACCAKLDSSRTSSVSTNRPHQVDAVHPFFNGYRSVKFDKSTSTDDQVFYCRQCQVRIDLCQEAVNQHFVSTKHTPIEENCVYCNTSVYEYFYNDNVCYYHRCPSELQQIHNSALEHSSGSPRHTSNK